MPQTAERKRFYRSQIKAMQKTFAKLGQRTVPGNTKLGYALKAWKKELVDDLGGECNVSLQQRTIIECAATTRLMITSVDAWLLSQESLITRDKTLIPVVLQRQQLVNGLTSMMSQLGLKRVVKEKSLDEILAEEGEQHEP